MFEYSYLPVSQIKKIKKLKKKKMINAKCL